MDSVGRGVIGVDPDLGLDEIGVPKTIAWKMYAPYIQSRLVQGGMSSAEAVKAIRDKTDSAYKALERETQERVCVFSRSPAWHRFSCLASYPKLIDGDAIMINSMVGSGIGGDHDGNCIIGCSKIMLAMSSETRKKCFVKSKQARLIARIADREIIEISIKDFPYIESTRILEKK
jgi:DNA-directed RNA polymerase subunit beta'